MPAGTFDLSSSSQSILVVGSGISIDYETRNNFIVAIKVTDSGTPARHDWENVTVVVIDVNEQPVFDDMVLSIPESSTNGLIVPGVLAAADEDFGQTLSYSILSQSISGTF